MFHAERRSNAEIPGRSSLESKIDRARIENEKKKGNKTGMDLVIEKSEKKDDVTKSQPTEATVATIKNSNKEKENADSDDEILDPVINYKTKKPTNLGDAVRTRQIKKIKNDESSDEEVPEISINVDDKTFNDFKLCRPLLKSIKHSWPECQN